MNYPDNLMYSKTHEWVEFIDEETAKVGLTDYAQQSLGSLVFINLPDEGSAIAAGEELSEVESVKAVSEVISPVSGTVSAVNEELLDAPEKINEAPYKSWIAEISGITDREELMDAGAYEAFCQEEE